MRHIRAPGSTGDAYTRKRARLWDELSNHSSVAVQSKAAGGVLRGGVVSDQSLEDLGSSDALSPF